MGKALRVVCGDGSVIDLLEVQPPGKKVRHGRAFHLNPALPNHR